MYITEKRITVVEENRTDIIYLLYNIIAMIVISDGVHMIFQWRVGGERLLEENF